MATGASANVLDPVSQNILTVSGGNTETKRNMVNLNEQITEMAAKSRADTLYDPQPPPPVTPGKLVAGFCNYSSSALAAAGILLIIFAFMKKRA